MTSFTKLKPRQLLVESLMPGLWNIWNRNAFAEKTEGFTEWSWHGIFYKDQLITIRRKKHGRKAR